MWFRSPAPFPKSAPTGRRRFNDPAGDTPPGCGSKPWRTAACCRAPSRWPRATTPPLVGERGHLDRHGHRLSGRPPSTSSAPRPHGGAFHVVRDFSPANTFAWTPMQEGTYDIEVTVKDGYQATETTSAVVADDVASRVTGSQAVVTPTANPLVALYSVPPVLGRVGVRPVRRGGRPPGLAEHRHARRRAGEEHELLRGGHAAQHDLPDAARVQRRHRLRAPCSSRRGASPRRLTIPAFTVQQPPGPGSDADQDMVFHQLLQGNPSNARRSWRRTCRGG